MMCDNLPDWLVLGMLEHATGKYRTNNFTNIVFYNGSRIRFASSTGVGLRGCGESLTHFFTDEAAFCENMDEIWLSIYPCLTANGKSIICSSRKSENNNWFFNRWSKGWFISRETYNKNITSICVPWQRYPDRGYDWKKETIKMVGQKSFDLECECVLT
jgi:hypothetical protein